MAHIFTIILMSEVVSNLHKNFSGIAGHQKPTVRSMVGNILSGGGQMLITGRTAVKCNYYVKLERPFLCFILLQK